MNILLISDVEQAIDQTFLRWLINLGCRVTVMYNLKQGLEHLQTQAVDMLIIRQGNPACTASGKIELMHQLCEKSGTAVKIFLSTCYRIEAVEQTIKSVGFDHVFFLPINIERIRPIITALSSKGSS